MLPRFISVLLATLTIGVALAWSAEQDVGRLQASIRNAVAIKGKGFEADIRAYYEAFLLLRSCNALNSGAKVVVDNAELAKVRWWLHSFQSALKLEASILRRAGVQDDEIWPLAERNTEGFRRRLARTGNDAPAAAEVATTCQNALAVFRSGEPTDPTKLNF